MKLREKLYFIVWLMIGVNAFPSKAQTSNDIPALNEGFLIHLYQTGEYEALFNITERTLALPTIQATTEQTLLYFYNSLAATKLERYSRITNNENNWSVSDSSDRHFNHLLLANIAAIKLKNDSLSTKFLTALHAHKTNKEFGEMVFLMDVFDTVVRQKKEPCINSKEKLISLSILTAEDSKDICRAITVLLHPKKKSAFIAGGMSALIPGAGKWYAGYFGTPFAALFLNAILGGVAIELAIKQGWNSWPALLSYAAFGTFYAGNIIGSIYSTKIKKKENEAFYKGVLLYHLMSAFERVYRG